LQEGEGVTRTQTVSGANLPAPRQSERRSFVVRATASGQFLDRPLAAPDALRKAPNAIGRFAGERGSSNECEKNGYPNRNQVRKQKDPSTSTMIKLNPPHGSNSMDHALDFKTSIHEK